MSLKGLLLDFGDTLVEESRGISIPLSQAELNPTEHSEQILRGLSKGLVLGVISNTFTADDDDIRDALERVGLLRFVQTVVTSVSCGYAKPDSEIYHLALERLALSASEVIMVGDRLDTDILGASLLGMHSIHLRWPGRPGGLGEDGDHSPTAEIESLSELPGAIDLVAPLLGE